MVTASRIRVLTAYRRKREQGIIPAHAMQAVLVDTHRQLTEPHTTRRDAELHWDREYSRRYLGAIDLRSVDLPYWQKGRLA